MPNLLISGPAGAGKSQVARARLAERNGLAIVADFQSLYAALRQELRGPDGKFPIRDNRYVPLVERIRLNLIEEARNSDIGVITTNSDRNAVRREFLLDRLGPESQEEIVDPGRAVVTRRLAAADGSLSPACKQALARWYGDAA